MRSSDEGDTPRTPAPPPVVPLLPVPPRLPLLARALSARGGASAPGGCRPRSRCRSEAERARVVGERGTPSLGAPPRALWAGEEPSRSFKGDTAPRPAAAAASGGAATASVGLDAVLGASEAPARWRSETAKRSVELRLRRRRSGRGWARGWARAAGALAAAAAASASARWRSSSASLAACARALMPRRPGCSICTSSNNEDAGARMSFSVIRFWLDMTGCERRKQKACSSDRIMAPPV